MYVLVEFANTVYCGQFLLTSLLMCYFVLFISQPPLIFVAVGLSQPSISTTLTSSNLETLAGYGDTVMDIVCRDACEGHHVGRVCYADDCISVVLKCLLSTQRVFR